ncbi:MAG: ABC transporter ATP-binding protein [SAR324 cluster bacterium]|nr:ABC transporter ATP-binding protein [SAR324 cluster bacterium]
MNQTSKENLLEIKSLSAGYSSQVNIISDISLWVNEGEILTILGPNGAGKSTLIKSLCGLLRFTSGSILFRQNEIIGLKTHQIISQSIAYVPQTNNVFSRLSVEHNLDLGSLANPQIHDQRLEHVFELFPDLKRFLGKKAGILSGGQRQMLAIARALMSAPAMLLLDEPSAGLSPLFRRQVFEHVKKIKESGVTVLMVEQNAKAALKVSDRGIILSDGKLRLEGAADELLESPEIGEIYFGTQAMSSK